MSTDAYKHSCTEGSEATFIKLQLAPVCVRKRTISNIVSESARLKKKSLIEPVRLNTRRFASISAASLCSAAARR